jgi:hypothetical protein
LISKPKTFVIVGILMVAAAAVSAIAVTKWNLFAPKDYEECAERAARDAKSKDALSILVSVCRSNFAGRRKTGGGYTYYDPCQDSTFDINGPNPTSDEVKYIRDQCLAYLSLKSQMEAEEAELKRRAQQEAQQARAAAQRAEQEARARAQQTEQAASAALQARILAAMSAVQVTSQGFSLCDEYSSFCTLRVGVTNGSKEALSKIGIGLSSIQAAGDACPSSYATRVILDVKLSPGEKRGTTVHIDDNEFAKHPLCIKVIGVEFAGR